MVLLRNFLIYKDQVVNTAYSTCFLSFLLEFPTFTIKAGILSFLETARGV